jgi:hypothetical protein
VSPDLLIDLDLKHTRIFEHKFVCHRSGVRLLNREHEPILEQNEGGNNQHVPSEEAADLHQPADWATIFFASGVG